MNYKDVLEFCDKAQEISPADFSDGENSGDYFEEIMKMGSYFNDKGDIGKEIILQRMNEEDFVKLVRAAKATLISSMFTQGDGATLLMSEISGDLDGYTHTMILNILGMLAEAEVI